MGGRPESIAADRDMPGDVPVATESIGGNGDSEAPDVPGNSCDSRGYIGTLDDADGSVESDISKRNVSHDFAWRDSTSIANPGATCVQVAKISSKKFTIAF